jgi:hypothetical protein
MIRSISGGCFLGFFGFFDIGWLPAFFGPTLVKQKGPTIMEAEAAGPWN